MNNPNVVGFNDEFTRAHIEDNMPKGGKVPPEELVKEVEIQIEKTLKDGKTVIFKDTGDFTITFFEDILKKWNTKFNTKFMYLVRHPLTTYVSFKQKMDHEINELKRFPLEWLLERLNMDYYTSLLKLYEVFGGKVVISEDLQENPTKVFKEIYDYCGLEFKEELLTFKPLIQEGLPKRWEFLKHFYDECFNSTTLRAGVTDMSKLVVEDKEVLEQIKIREEVYNKLKEVRKNQLDEVK